MRCVTSAGPSEECTERGIRCVAAEPSEECTETDEHCVTSPGPSECTESVVCCCMTARTIPSLYLPKNALGATCLARLNHYVLKSAHWERRAPRDFCRTS